jgi:hypothetical protein
MASEILLVPVDAPPVPVEPLPSESGDPSVVLQDEPLPVKRGRGRPPGAKNKAKSDVEPPTPRNATPRVTRMSPPLEDEEEDVAPLPPPVKKKPKAPVVPRVEREDELEPPSPRAQRRQIHIAAQTRRHDQHTERIRGYSTLLDTMLGY